jgi:hypothetical protein
VIQGKVVRQQVVLEGGQIWTDSQVQVTETVKGRVLSGRTLTLRQMGGETPTLGQKVAGMAQFQLGEQVLVFARAVGNRFFVPVGACLGKFRVYRDRRGNLRARRHLRDATFARIDASGRLEIEPGVTLVEDSDMALSELLEAIAAAQGKGGVR